MQYSGRCFKLLSAFVLLVFQVSETCAASVLQSGIYYRDKKFDDLLPKTVTQWSPADSVVQCGRLCQTEKWCNSFFYSHGKASCALQRMVYRELGSNRTVAAPGWVYFQVTSAQCPSKRDYVIDRLTATCYKFVTSPRLSWLDARAACNSSNERLVVLEPVEKARFLQDFLKTNIALHNFSGGVQIGGSRPATDWNTPVSPTGPSFVWIDGQSMDLNALRPYWRSSPEWDKPNKNAIALKRINQYLLGVGRETTKRFYVCEKAYL